MCRKPIGHGLFLRCLLGDAGGDACVGIGLDFLLRMTGFVIPGGMQWSVGIFPLFSQCDPAGRRPAMCGRKRMIIIAHSAQLSPHCEKSGRRADGGSPTFSLYGCFWRHLLAAKGGKNRSSQEHANRRFGNSPTFLRKHSFLYFRLDPQVHDRARFLASAEVASSLCENVRRGGDVRFGERWKQHRRCNGNCSACAMAWRCLRTVRRI